MDTRKFAIKQAVKLVSTLSIENKTKAVFDLADSIEQWIGEPPRDNEKWWKQGIFSNPADTTLTTSGYSDSSIRAYTSPSKDYDAVQASIAMSDILYGEPKLDDEQ